MRKARDIGDCSEDYQLWDGIHPNDDGVGIVRTSFVLRRSKVCLPAKCSNNYCRWFQEKKVPYTLPYCDEIGHTIIWLKNIQVSGKMFFKKIFSSCFGFPTLQSCTIFTLIWSCVAKIRIKSTAMVSCKNSGVDQKIVFFCEGSLKSLFFFRQSWFGLPEVHRMQQNSWHANDGSYVLSFLKRQNYRKTSRHCYGDSRNDFRQQIVHQNIYLK